MFCFNAYKHRIVNLGMHIYDTFGRQKGDVPKRRLPARAVCNQPSHYIPLPSLKQIWS